MADYANILTSNESVLRVAHRHVLFMILNTVLWLVGSFALIALAVVVYLVSPWQESLLAGIVLVLSFVPLGVTVYRFFLWRTERYILTTFRIVQLEGILNKRYLDSALEMINDVEMHQTLFGRMFNYGTIHILTASDSAINDLDGVSDPFDFKRQMVGAKMRLSMEGVASAPAPAQSSPSDGDDAYESNARLVVALTELRNSGMISDKEFDEKMRKLTGT